jgi:hypothetical protein
VRGKFLVRYIEFSMKFLFDLLLIVFAGFWLFMAARGTTRELESGGKLKWLLAASALVGLLGFGGFFAQMISGAGMLKLPRSSEWPAGYATNVITTIDGKYVVPIVPAGRVQVYDSDWHFLCGWNVDALGGDFKIRVNSSGAVEVLTARGEHQYTFNQNGNLVSSTALSESYYSLPNMGQPKVVPTMFFLWPFSSPFISVVVGTIGILGLALFRKFARNQA